MSIASAITAAQGKIANAYTAISNKGGTLPAAQNLSNMPAAINSISGGGGSFDIVSFYAYEALNVSFDDASDFPSEYADALDGGFWVDNVAAYLICNSNSVDNYTVIQLIVATYLTNGSDTLPFSFKIDASEGFDYDERGIITFTNASASFIFPDEDYTISGSITIELSFEGLEYVTITNAN